VSSPDVASLKFQRPPLVYISYARADEAWVNKLLIWLEPISLNGLIRIFYDRQIPAGTDWNEALRSNLKDVALGIILLSPSWLDSEYAVQVELPVLSSRHLIPILVRECYWKARPEISSRQIIRADDKPLSSVRRAKQEQAFRSVIAAVRSALGLAAGTGLDTSEEVQKIFEHAARLARSRPSGAPIDSTCLLYALLERGREEPTPIRSPQFLWNSIPEAGHVRYLDLRNEQFPLGTRLSTDSATVADRIPDLPVLDSASALSSNTLTGGTIHARHLLAAILVDPDAAPKLTQLDLDVAAFQKTFLEFVLKTFPSDPRDLWTSFLANEPESDEGSTEGTEHPRVIATYQSEDWNGRDLLNIRRDVNALATLVAGWSVHPPLSIGLFGEWGSGKSFFMRQMRERVKELALAAQKSRRQQRRCAYYKNIAQIEFNAWHYMEGDNLWACLVEHIFSNLGLPQDKTEEEIEIRQRQILERIGAKKTLEQQAAARTKELEAKKTEAERKAQEAHTELDAKKSALKKEQSALLGGGVKSFV
jgi:TIR domain/KAP family P-loop domain